MSCLRCVYFKPNSILPYIGYCEARRRAESAIEHGAPCGDFREATIDELKAVLEKEGWLYCLTCASTITSEEELLEHYRKHVVIPGVLVDESVAEEAPSGD
ncbi:hypothetical protein IMZ38_01215 [Thermosphaera chiliense]|uniref:C2H2-type domain-containing protein n=1 Tax=Thermosphaera chiliense TaxID=3402707 RepID=A0A7M1USQ2_9CREN|nr:hypothetical protein [Thermosphaera aggregans]QOR94587.1 hypothetical protein IMZ38_01215 [Thermosphaera aggregans]